ncbi:MAG TPA: 3-hydroxy-3-methylglutaryl-CoA reductase, partial [Anaerolineales bacterium]|nr:3-hydroxy-3-methylglutaryl-CoA reductase [Anaerolineales bacterium]
MTNSRIAGFYALSLAARRAKLAEAFAPQTPPELTAWTTGGLSAETADHMIENVVGMYSLPLGVALNFTVNGRDVLIPMVVEEPSIVAGASFMAKLARANGGFTATSTEPLMIGQLQVLDVEELNKAVERVLAHKAELLTYVDEAESSLKSRGGGARDIEDRIIEESPIGEFLVIHLIYDVRDAMGANAVNTACERLAPKIEEITGGRVHLKILSNLSDKRMAKATCVIPVKELEIAAQDGILRYSGEEVRDGIIAAYAFAA